MPRYMQLGQVPAKRHTVLPAAPGHKAEGLYYEEVISTQGFSRGYSIAYHLRPPTRVKSIEPAGVMRAELAPTELLRHVHLKTKALPRQGDVIHGRVPMFGNAAVTLYRCRPAEPQRELFRNAVADEVLFVHGGRGQLLTHFGALPFRPYDYIVIPKCTTYRVEAAEPLDLLVIEARGTIRFPQRYLNPEGQFRLGAPFGERDLHGPTSIHCIDSEQETPVLIKDGERLSRYLLRSHPFDV
ncbi:MAG: homogentisate 1,2-dioxygenase, partial [Gemmataceae bacterium]